MKSENEIITFVIQEVNKATLGEITISEAQTELGLIDDLGLDSLDYASVMISTEEWLGIHVPEGDIDWAKLRSANALSNFLYNLQFK